MDQGDNTHQKSEHNSKPDSMSIYKTFQPIIHNAHSFQGHREQTLMKTDLQSKSKKSERTYFLHHNAI